MDDRLRIEQGEILDLVRIIRRNRRWGEEPANCFMKKTAASPPPRHAELEIAVVKNVQHHYDIGNDLYRSFSIRNAI